MENKKKNAAKLAQATQGAKTTAYWLNMLVGICVSLFTLTMLVLVFLRYQDAQRKAFDEAYRDARFAATALDRTNQSLFMEINTLAQSPEGQAAALGRCPPSLNKRMEARPYLVNIVFYDALGLPSCSMLPLPQSINGVEQFSVKSIPGLVLNSTPLPSTSHPFNNIHVDSQTSQSLHYALAVRVFDSDNKPMGAVSYIVSLPEVINLLALGDLLTLQKQGALLFYVPGFGVAGGSGVFDKKNVLPGMKSLDSKTLLLLEQMTEQKGSKRTRSDDGSFYVSQKTNTTDWTVIAHLSSQSALGDVLVQIIIQSLGTILSIIIGLLFARIIAKRLSRATRQLAHLASKPGYLPEKTGIYEIDVSMRQIVQSRALHLQAEQSIALWHRASERSSTGLALLAAQGNRVRIVRANASFYKYAGLAKIQTDLNIESLPPHSALKDPTVYQSLHSALFDKGWIQHLARGSDAAGNELRISIDLAPLDLTDTIGTLEPTDHLPQEKPKVKVPLASAEKNERRPSSPSPKQKVKSNHSVSERSTESVRYFALTLDDLTQMLERDEALERQSTTDAMTGLPNRTLFGDRLQVALDLAARQDSRCAILFLDIDRFKHINDTLGHATGDQVIIAVANRLQARIRSGDTLCRFGADEFAIIINEPLGGSKNHIIFSIDHIREAFFKAFVVDGHELNLSCSLGATFYPDDGTEASELLQRTDIALFKSKDAGGGRMTAFSAQMGNQFEERVELETQLRSALKNQELRMYYQPKIDLKTFTITGVEALARWSHAERGFISPGKFIPLAEESGLIGELGRFALRTSVADAKRLTEAGHHIPVAVNISSLQIEPGFIEEIRDVLDAHKLDPKYLHAEITESLILPNSQECIKFLQDLTNMGIEISLDDFGTGWSNLATLKRLPLTALKMDRSFVEKVDHNQDDMVLAHMVVSLAKALKLYVIAEGVETGKQAKVLQNMGVSQAQGYLFAKPMPFDQLLLWIEQFGAQSHTMLSSPAVGSLSASAIEPFSLTGILTAPKPPDESTSGQ